MVDVDVLSSLEELIVSGVSLSGVLAPVGDVQFEFLVLFIIESVVLLYEMVSERSGVDSNNGVLYQGVGPHKLVIGRVVDHVQNLGLKSNSLSLPIEVTGVESQGSELIVSSSHPDLLDLFGTQLSMSHWSSSFENSFLLVDGHSSSG